MQCERKHKYTQTHINLRTVKWAQCDKTNPENCKNCSFKCAYDCAQLQYTIQQERRARGHLQCYCKNVKYSVHFSSVDCQLIGKCLCVSDRSL